MLGGGARTKFLLKRIQICVLCNFWRGIIHLVVLYTVAMTIFLQMAVRCLEEGALFSNVYRVALSASHGAGGWVLNSKKVWMLQILS